MNFIVLSIPVFFILITIELLIAKLSEKHVYRLNDAVNDLSCGITQQIIGAFAKTLLFGVYVLAYRFCEANELTILSVDNSISYWIIAFIGYDFLYYWAHRCSHTIAIGWAGHVVHHQSEEFNLAVALRQGTFQSFFTFMFYLPLAILGIPPTMYIVVKAFDALYQFWIHTRLIKRVGFLEWFLNTPSHHRVHHGRNSEYLDKNYGGILIIWDRLFGTFASEKTEVSYGITHSLNSWNPVWANMKYFVYLVKLSFRAPYWKDKIKLWFMPPGWLPRGINSEGQRTPLDYKYDPQIPFGLKVYAAIQFAIANFLGIVLLYNFNDWHFQKYIIAIFVILSLVSVGAIFDHKKWGKLFENIRLCILIFLCTYYAFLLKLYLAFIIAIFVTIVFIIILNFKLTYEYEG